jgi:hypothetical protein
MKLSKESIFKNNRLRLHVGATLSRDKVDYKLICPFTRSWVGMSIAAVITIIFASIGYSTLGDAISSWQQANNLFNLVAALFTSFWLVGWSIGIIIPLIAFLAMAFGRQVLLIHSGRMEMIIGVPGLGIRISASASEVTGVRLIEYSDSSVFPKKGMQIEIETGLDDKNTPIGSDMTSLDVSQIKAAINRNKDLFSGLDPYPSNAPKDESANTQFSNQSLPNVDQPVTLMSGSALVLVLANLIPLAGVYWLDWDLGSTMVLYWAESAIILFYTVAKSIVRNRILGMIGGLFTIAHAGAFMAIHFLFIWTIFVEKSFTGGAIDDNSLSTVAVYLTALWPALLGLLVSHGYSFKSNFLDELSGQQLGKKTAQEKESFYSRMILMHITIIIGGGLALIFDDNIFALSLLIVMKTVVDLKAHLKQHSGNA